MELIKHEVVYMPDDDGQLFIRAREAFVISEKELEYILQDFHNQPLHALSFIQSITKQQ